MSAADAEQLRQAWDYIERNGFRTLDTGYMSPGDECAACALGALAYTAQMDLHAIAWAPDRCGGTYRAIVGETWGAARWLYRTQVWRSGLSNLYARAAKAIYRHNDMWVVDIEGARTWFARAIELAEAHA